MCVRAALVPLSVVQARAGAGVSTALASAKAQNVDVASPAKLAASKVLGFTLITIGLTLLTLVAIGFFTSH